MFGNKNQQNNLHESPIKGNLVNGKQGGGHLFSYNEIRDHKLTLNSIRKHIQKTKAGSDNAFNSFKNDGRYEVSSGFIIHNLIAASPSEKKIRMMHKQQED